MTDITTDYLWEYFGHDNRMKVANMATNGEASKYRSPCALPRACLWLRRMSLTRYA